MKKRLRLSRRMFTRPERECSSLLIFYRRLSQGRCYNGRAKLYERDVPYSYKTKYVILFHLRDYIREKTIPGLGHRTSWFHMLDTEKSELSGDSLAIFTTGIVLSVFSFSFQLFVVILVTGLLLASEIPDASQHRLLKISTHSQIRVLTRDGMRREMVSGANSCYLFGRIIRKKWKGSKECFPLMLIVLNFSEFSFSLQSARCSLEHLATFHHLREMYRPWLYSQVFGHIANWHLIYSSA